jgi:predicted amino acid-binding ACT domain protein
MLLRSISTLRTPQKLNSVSPPKKTERSEAISKARLVKLKKSRENEAKLRESLDSTTETFEVQLAKAHAEIGLLTEMLADSNTEVETLQGALVQAQEELAVSVALQLEYIELALTPLLYAPTET